MGIRLNPKLEKGWRTKNPESRGDVQVVEFLNSRTNELLFTYAPKWEDIPTWLIVLSQMCELEKTKMNKKMKEVKNDQDYSQL